MTAFNTAWDLLKAPLLPETVDIDPKTRTGSAMFEFRPWDELDGVPKKIPLRMQPPSVGRPETEIFVDYPFGNNQTLEELREDPESSIGYARFHEIDRYTGNDTMPFVEHGFRGLGISTALYDFMQMLLNARGKGEYIKPSTGQTPDGVNLWRGALEREPLFYDEQRQMVDWEGEVWPHWGVLR